MRNPVRRRRIVIAATATAAAVALTLGATAPAIADGNAATTPTKTTKTINATTYTTWYPAMYQTTGGKFTGYQFQIVANAVKELGWKVNWTAPTFDTIEPGVISGKYDFGSGFDITAERLKVLDIVPTLKTAQTLLTQKSAKKIGAAVTSMCGLRVAIDTGENDEGLIAANKKCASQGKSEITIPTYKDLATEVLALQAGNVDAVMINTTDVGAYTKDHPTFKENGPIFQQVLGGAAFVKGSPLAKQFAKGMNKSIKDGSYAKIIKKWNAGETTLTHVTVSPKP